jgi:hypothetical protein
MGHVSPKECLTPRRPADSHAMRVIGVAGVALCAAAMLAAGCSGGRDIPLETVAKRRLQDRVRRDCPGLVRRNGHLQS